MKLQLKRSSVLENNAAKEPTPSQMEYGELAVNYNNGDPAIFLKDSNDNIIRISGVGNISDDGQVEIPSDANPPTDSVSGNLWYNPLDGRLYVYYVDDNTAQWVDASPDSWQPGLIPDPDDPSNQLGTLDDRYVNITGDDMTGNLTLGTDKITLNAAAGSITAAGGANFGTTVTAGSLDYTDQYAYISPDGIGLQNNASDSVFVVYGNTGNIVTDGSITAAGTGSFGDTLSIPSASDAALRIGKAGVGYAGVWDSDGDIKLGTNLFAGAEDIKLTLNANGSIEAAGTVNAFAFGTTDNEDFYVQEKYQQGAIGTARGAAVLRLSDIDGTHGAQQALRITQNGNQPPDATIALNYDGSITAAGDVQVGGNPHTETGVDIRAIGLVKAARTGATDALWAGFTTGNGAATSQIFADGSITAAGDVKIGTTGSFTPSTPAISLNADGTITAAGDIFAGPVRGDVGYFVGSYLASTNGVLVTGDSSPVWRGYDKGIGTPTSQIDSSGSITAAGDVKIGAATGGNRGINLYKDGGINIYNSATTVETALSVVDKDGNQPFIVTTEGSATFAGSLSCGSNLSNASSAKAVVTNQGTFTSYKGGASTDTAFAAYSVSAGSNTVEISANGSAEFAGSCEAKDFRSDNADDFYAAGGYQQSGVGTARGAGLIRMTDTDSTHGAQAAIRITQGGNQPIDSTISLDYDGSASFAGNVTAGTFPDGNGINADVTNGCYSVRNDNASATNGTEQAFRIYSGGKTQADVTAKINSNGSAEFASGDIVISNQGTFGAKFEVYRDAPSIAFSVRSTADRATDAISLLGNGSAVYTGTVTATVVPPSDARFKENITPAKPQLADVVALGGILKNYDWNDQAPLNEEIRSQRQLGLIAQEAAEVCPAIVKDIHRTKQGAVITPEEIIPAVVEPAYTIPAVTKEIPNPKASKKGETITVEVKPAEEVPEQVITPEQVIPATYETLDDSYKGISTDALIMKLIGAVTELKAELDALKGA